MHDADGHPTKIAVQSRHRWRRRWIARSGIRGAFPLRLRERAVGIALSDLDAQTGEVNRFLCFLLGVSEKEILGTELRYITHPEDVDNDVNPQAKLLSDE